MTERDNSKFTLWWTSSDRQGSMWGGDYESEAEAWAAQQKVEKEFREQCSDDSPYDEDSIWSVEAPDSDE